MKNPFANLWFIKKPIFNFPSFQWWRTHAIDWIQFANCHQPNTYFYHALIAKSPFTDQLIVALSDWIHSLRTRGLVARIFGFKGQLPIILVFIYKMTMRPALFNEIKLICSLLQQNNLQNSATLPNAVDKWMSKIHSYIAYQRLWSFTILIWMSIEKDKVSVNAYSQASLIEMLSKWFSNSKEAKILDEYLKNSHPGKPYVIKWYGALERVVTNRLADGVILIPVDTGFICWRIVSMNKSTCIARPAIEGHDWEVGALCHSTVLCPAADEVLIIVPYVMVSQIHPKMAKPQNH